MPYPLGHRVSYSAEGDDSARLVARGSQFARVVKGVDLRSTAGNCAWARTPQLTHMHAPRG